MLTRLFVGCAVVVSMSAVAHAAPADDVQAAAKKLAASGYTFKTSSEGGAGGGGGGGARGGGGQTGKVDKDGTALLTLARGDAQTQVVVGKDGKGAVKSGDEGWKSLAELEAAPAGDRPNPARLTGRMIRAFKAPAAQAEALATKVKELKKTDDGFAGDLTEEGVKELAAFGGGGRRGGAGGGGGGNAPAAPALKDGKGTVAFTVKDGTLTRVKYTVQGKMTFGDQERDINRTTTVEFTDVGNTKVEIPAEAKAKAGL